MHDLFDTVADSYDPLIMTVWEPDEPLDEAIWEFLYTTHQHAEYWDTCRSAIAVSVGHPDWAAQIERRLRDVRSLNRDVLPGA